MRTSITLAAMGAWLHTGAIAGYGGMGNVEAEGGSSAGGGAIFFGALIGAAIGYGYCVLRNMHSEEPIAPDGGAVIGLILGGLLLPFLWLALSK